MVYAESEVWYRDTHQQKDAKRRVNDQVAKESTLEPQIPDLP